MQKEFVDARGDGVEINALLKKGNCELQKSVVKCMTIIYSRALNPRFLIT